MMRRTFPAFRMAATGGTGNGDLIYVPSQNMGKRTGAQGNNRLKTPCNGQAVRIVVRWKKWPVR